MALALISYKMEKQNFSASGAEAGRLHSQTFFECKLTIPGSDETMVLPVQTCTHCEELKLVLVAKLGDINPDEISFVVKQGCTFRRMLPTDQVLRTMMVQGIKTFKEQLHKYPHPYGIIGAGYNGIKTALFMEHAGQTDYVIFDRYDRVGGHCWLECANRTTRLQTEFSAYHVWYGKEWSNPEATKCGGVPINWEIWPTADRILEHFQLAVDEYGIVPHIRFETDVESTDLIGKITDPSRYYNFHCVPKIAHRKTKQGGGALEHQIKDTEVVEQNMASTGYAGAFKRDPNKEPYTFTCSCFVLWPGNLINPRQLIYKGEDQFDGVIDYGVEMRVDYNVCTGKKCIIHGHGAFAMENIRTCMEYGAMKIDVLCRKRNLTCPRVVSWFINQSDPPISAVQCLNQLRVSYKLAKYDPWDMHSVTYNESRTHATFNQKTRFGIGDVYFLGQAYGIVEIVVDNVKRLTQNTVHLESGQKLENIGVILKCVGMLPDWTVEKVLKSKFLRGYWINGDVRRFTCADPDGIAASNFGATTVGPGSYSWVKMMKHFWDQPSDWQRLEDGGLINMLPIHNSGEPDPDTPAYFIDARHSTQTGMTIGGICPMLTEKSIGDGAYKKWVVNYCTPAEKFLPAAQQEWLNYEKMFREKGMCPEDAPYVPYPYDLEWIENEHKVHMADLAHKQSVLESRRQ